MTDKKVSKKKNAKEIKKPDALKAIREGIFSELENSKNAKYYRAIFSAVLGSIPWVGGIYSALIALQAESGQEAINNLQKLWLKEHQDKILELSQTLKEITYRLDEFSKKSEVEEIVRNRIQSPEYLNLVKETFRAWDEASTLEKRDMFKKLITNAAAIKLCSDDLVRLFIKWIREYHEYHFQVVAEIYRNPGTTRGAIWDHLFGERPREDSAKADFYKYLIRELSMGGVIRQKIEKNVYGEILKKHSKKRSSSSIKMSAFDEKEEYELTELGAQFIHYVMEDVVLQISDRER